MNKVSSKLKKYKNTSADSDDMAINNYFHNDDAYKTPSSGKQYIGIEVECFTKMDKTSLQKLFFKYDLEDYVMIGSDSSIDPGEEPAYENYWNAFEIRLLIPQLELSPILKKLGRVFRIARLKVNDTCGLHVHIDMRQRNEDSCFKKLLNFQNALFAIVNKDRWNNEYCQQTDEEDSDHHMAINVEAFEEHQTIEVRMHHGCVDTKQIEKWIRLLLNVVDSKNVPLIASKADLFKWKGLHRKLRFYVRSNFKDEWFDQKDGFDY